jgi:hypothetical protein
MYVVANIQYPYICQIKLALITCKLQKCDCENL